MNGDWGGQQTFAIHQAKYEWIFFIDADERCTPELGKEIKDAIKKTKNMLTGLNVRIDSILIKLNMVR